MMKISMRSMTKKAKDVLPEPAVKGIKSVLRAAGTATASARMLPDFIVIGAQRSGTTSLYRLLSEHPEVVRPTASKGIGYFDDQYSRSQRWYRGHFPLKPVARFLTRPAIPKVFESSGYYSFHPLSAQRIATDLPDAKLVMMLRDPVERAYSAHRHELVRGYETEEFTHALDLEESRLDGEYERLVNEPGYTSFSHRHHAYLTRGKYAEQVERIHQAMGPDRLYLMDADDFFGNPREEFLRLQRWLGLTEWQPRQVPAENAQPRSPMDPELHERLRTYYEEADARLAQLMDREPSWRRVIDPR